MSSVTIDQMNEVIAWFMGDYREKQMDAGMQLKYHTSWDWLMPVVKKIKYDNNSVIRMESSGIKDSIMPFIKAMQPMNRSLIKADLDGVLKGVYQFIQWYNKNKN